MPPEARYRVVFDRQLVQDSDVGAPAMPVQRDSLLGTPPVSAIEIAAIPPGALVPVEDPTSGRRQCTVPDTRLDVAVLRLETAVTARGFARVRGGAVEPDQILPIIHSPGGSGSHLMAFGRVLSAPTFPDHIHAAEIALPETAEGALGPGSSGAPLFDEEGYVVGVYSNAGCPGTACQEFVSMRFALPFLDALTEAPHIARSGLGLFTTPPFGGYQLERQQFSARDEQPIAVAPLPDGFVTGGFYTTPGGARAFALAGYDNTGLLDGSFGSAGLITDDEATSGREEIVDLTVQTVAGGPTLLAAANVADPDSIALVRYQRDGTRDTTFGTGGLHRVDTRGFAASASAVAIDPADGSILVAGHAAFPTLGREYETPVVARLDPDGTPVSDCGTSGVFIWRPEVTTTTNTFVTGPVDSYDMVVTDMAVADDGGIVLVGYLHQLDFHARAPWMGRLTAECAPDPDFGDNGTAVKIIPTDGLLGGEADNAWLSAVVVDGSRAYAAGTAATFRLGRGLFGGRMFVVATLRDGSLDSSFGAPFGSGATVLPPAGWHEVSHGLARTPGADGEFVVVGESFENVASSRRRVRAARLANDGLLVGITRPANVLGVLDAWATDVTLGADGQPVMSVAVREDPNPFPPPDP